MLTFGRVESWPSMPAVLGGGWASGAVEFCAPTEIAVARATSATAGYFRIEHPHFRELSRVVNRSLDLRRWWRAFETVLVRELSLKFNGRPSFGLSLFNVTIGAADLILILTFVAQTLQAAKASAPSG